MGRFLMPDIPAIAPSKNLMLLGEGLMKVGAAISNIYGAQKAYLDAEIFSEVTQAKNYANEQTQLFNNDIYNNPNPDEYLPKWTEKTTEIQDGVAPFLKHPEARKLFDEYWVTKNNGQLKGVSDLALDRNIGKAEALAVTTISNAVESGDVQTAYDTAVDANKRGVISNDELRTVIEKDIPKAKFNSAFAQLSLIDYQSQIVNLTSPDAEKRLGLDSSQIKDMRTKLEDKHASDMKIGEEQRKAAQVKDFTGFLEASKDPAILIPRDRVTQLMTELVGSEYYSGVKAYRDNLDAETKRIADHKITAGQTKNYSQLDISMTMWDPSVIKTPPWNPNDLGKLVNNEDPLLSITEPEYNQLMSLYKQTMDDIATGKRKGAPGFKDEAKIAEAWNIVYDVKNKWTQTEKGRRLNSGNFLNQGIPGDLYGQMLKAIDEFGDNDERKDFLAPIEDYYDAQMRALETTKGAASDMQRIAYEKYTATQTLIDYMVNNPDDKNAWGKKVDELMTGTLEKEINKMVEKQIGGSFPGLFQGQLSAEMKLDIAREQLGGTITSSPELMPKLKTAYPKIQEEEKSVLWWKGIKDITAISQTKSGDFNYKASDGNIYKVTGETVGGVIRNVVYKRVGNGWEQVK
jgi:hypothetical protein